MMFKMMNFELKIVHSISANLPGLVGQEVEPAVTSWKVRLIEVTLRNLRIVALRVVHSAYPACLPSVLSAQVRFDARFSSIRTTSAA